MKKVFSLFLLALFTLVSSGFTTGASAFAKKASKEAKTVQSSVEVEQKTKKGGKHHTTVATVNFREFDPTAPDWEEYVAPKYRVPRTDFTPGKAWAEIGVGDLLTATILGAPIGIPLISHGVTKVKMRSYANRKNIFNEQMTEAVKIADEDQRQAEYKEILAKCHLKEKTRRHYAKKEAKNKK